MAEENADLVFDLSKKKKKKATKKLAELEDEVAVVPEAEDAAAPETAEGTEEGELDFSALKKKKKKKVKKAEDDEADEDEAADEADAVDADFTGKKKKKKKAKLPLEDEVTEETADKENEGEQDYEYQELLDRVFEIMRSKNPELANGEKKRFKTKPPQVVRLGTKKTGFVNCTEIAKLLRRQVDHIMAFIFTELGTSGALDSSECLVIKGRFQAKHIESVLRRYIREYVTCHTCKSPDTNLVKENRLYFLTCNTCGSRCSVASIKSGFQAVTGKRAKMRANAT